MTSVLDQKLNLRQAGAVVAWVVILLAIAVPFGPRFSKLLGNSLLLLWLALLLQTVYLLRTKHQGTPSGQNTGSA